ncbi:MULTISPECIES: ribonuclease domain-containing protein [unclassified Psychrobacter]|uniref:ribonuclease domain-containing protein n=1 Tax=unclassified Psychrobacter TaxID=196806 RepID=UPI000946DADA|nr:MULTISPECIES: ribonuclease domain-containing protein [unclassified Psychrobacter]OLF37032.1 DNA-binding protein [Psychrobacter sp. Cmf 22.2]
MQSGKIKHYNIDKGYGFIDVDEQNEDVFFHVSKVRLSQPITIGQRVYFNSERNDKSQLRATKVTDASLSIEQSTSRSKHTSVHSNQSNQNDGRRPSSVSSRNRHHTSSNQHQRHGNKSWKSTALSVLILIAVIFFGYTELKPALLGDAPSNTTSTSSYVETDTSAITGDPQVDQTIALIQQGGPFPYPNKDGTTFYNREGRLPAESQGYYREYTVPTPGVSHRGARRIVTGGNPPTVYYLTIDHYDSFRKLKVN